MRSLPTHRHVKTKKLYTLIGVAKHTETMEPLAVYESEIGGELWARPNEMFKDGRFQAIERPEILPLTEEEGSLLGYYARGHWHLEEFVAMVHEYGCDRRLKADDCCHVWYRTVPRSENGWSEFVSAPGPGRGAWAATMTEIEWIVRRREARERSRVHEQGRAQGHREGVNWALDWLHSKDPELYSKMHQEYNGRKS